MNTQVIFREYRDADYGALAEVIRETWNYDRFCSPKTAASIARVYLDSCLIQQTFTRVAEMDGIPVGVIMGKDIAHHRCPFSLRLKWLRSVAALALSSEGRKVSRIFAHVEKMDQELLAACGRHYGGELAFFAVGKRLQTGQNLRIALLAKQMSKTLLQLQIFFNRKLTTNLRDSGHFAVFSFKDRENSRELRQTRKLNRL